MSCYISSLKDKEVSSSIILWSQYDFMTKYYLISEWFLSESCLMTTNFHQLTAVSTWCISHMDWMVESKDVMRGDKTHKLWVEVDSIRGDK